MTDQPPLSPGMQVRPAEKTFPVVAIVGRPNVGKSALFNRLLMRRVAIVARESGVTRDRVSASVDFERKRFTAVDTGGLGLYDDEAAEDIWNHLIREQVDVAVATADHIIFVVDVQAGVTPLDEDIAQTLLQMDIPVTIAANKADNAELAANSVEFMNLGFGDVIPTCCTHNSGIGDLLEQVTADFPEIAASEADEVEERPLHIAVVGRPNVGKSSVLNRLIGEERVLVSEIPGTTRDAVDIPFELKLGADSLPGVLVDTAGLRKRGKIDDAIEYFSTTRTEAAIKRADMVMVVLDASEPATAQDKKICDMVYEAGKPCILLVNKWDLATEHIKRRELLEYLAWELPFMSHAQVIICCALSGYNFGEIVPTIPFLQQQLQLEVPTPVLNRVLQDAMDRNPPPMTPHGAFKIYYGVFAEDLPPCFVLFCNHRRRCPDSYLAYLRNTLTEAFGITALPVRVALRERPQDESRNHSQPDPERARANKKRRQKRGRH